MAMNMVETVNRIKKAGQTNVRSVPMAGQPVTGGLYQIEIKESAGWTVVAEGLPQTTAQDLIRQATSKVILG